MAVDSLTLPSFRSQKELDTLPYLFKKVAKRKIPMFLCTQGFLELLLLLVTSSGSRTSGEPHSLDTFAV
jgi:hypothetical protein